MFKFVAGLVLGLTLSAAVAQMQTKEIDCPPGGKVILSLEGGGGGGASSNGHRICPEAKDGHQYPCVQDGPQK